VVSLTLDDHEWPTAARKSLGSRTSKGLWTRMASRVFTINLDPAKGPMRRLSRNGTFGTNTSGEPRLRNLTACTGSSPLRVSFSVRGSPVPGKWYVEGSSKQSNISWQRTTIFALVQSCGADASVLQGSCKPSVGCSTNHATSTQPLRTPAYTPTVGGNNGINVAFAAVAGMAYADRLNKGTATLAKIRGRKTNLTIASRR